MIEVELNDLKHVGKELAGIIEQRLKTEVTVKGRTLIMSDERVGVKEAKLQLKHALHQLKLSEEYRVFVEHHKIRIVKVSQKSRYVGKEGTAPPPSRSLPYFFPG